VSEDAPAGDFELQRLIDGRALVLYDGLCGFCDTSMRWIAQKDQSDRIRFAPQQSDLAAAILARHGIDREAALKNNSVYVVMGAASDDEQLLAQSDVTIHVMLALGGRWRLLGCVLRAVPSFARNAIYRVVARNRYRLSARNGICPLPSDTQTMKFLA
jgi:predicted DCC family thiol-disulfide oxidoreductase YuxK